MLGELNLEEINDKTSEKEIKKRVKNNKNYLLVESTTERKSIIKEFLEGVIKLKNE